MMVYRKKHFLAVSDRSVPPGDPLPLLCWGNTVTEATVSNGWVTYS